MAVARRFAAAGIDWLHVVDLDAARTGDPAALAVIEAICAAVPDVRVQAGGGVRDAESAGALLGAGVARVVLGTAAIENPQLVGDLATMHPGAVAVGLDAREDGELAVRGWVQGGGVQVTEAARRFADVGVCALVMTSIGRDGMLTGPDIEMLGRVLAATDLPVIASGGVGTIDDIAQLRDLAADGRRLAGAIVGRALYEGRVDLAVAVELAGQVR